MVNDKNSRMYEENHLVLKDLEQRVFKNSLGSNKYCHLSQNELKTKVRKLSILHIRLYYTFEYD